MVQKAKAEDPQPLFFISPERASDPYAYLEAYMAVINAEGAGEVAAVDSARHQKSLSDACLAVTGLTLTEVAKDRQDPLTKFTSLMDLSIADAEKLVPAIRRIDDLKLSAEKKNEYIAWIERMNAIKRECIADSVKCMVYVMRDAEPASKDTPPERIDSSGSVILWMQWFHIKFHEILSDDAYRNCVIMCHPGTGKSFNAAGWVIHQIGNNPGLRVLLIQDQEDKPKKSIGQLVSIFKSSRFRALFPAVRVMERGDGAEESAFRFTVTRVNSNSKEPTFEAASIGSKINGNGYDLILGDDVCPEEVKREPATRQKINDKWVSVIEERLRGGDTKGRIKVIGTPWHPEDVLGIIRQEVNAGRLKGWRMGIDEFAIHDDAAGKAIPIWPERWKSAFYEDKKMRLGSAYALNYRLQPVENRYRAIQRLHLYNSRPGDSASTDFDKSRFDAIEAGERWLSIDPAATSGAQSCDNGVIDAVITGGGFACIRDIDFVQGNATEMCDWIIRRIYYAAQPGYAYIQFEAQGSISGQVHLWKHMIEEALRTGLIPDKDSTGERIVAQLSPLQNIPIIVSSGVRWGNKQNMSKLDRLKEVVPFIENGIVRFPGCRVAVPGKTGTGLRVIPGSRMERFYDILRHFDGTNNADAVDALTQWILYNRHRIKDPSVRAEVPIAEKRMDAITAAFVRAMDEPDAVPASSYDQESDFWSSKVA